MEGSLIVETHTLTQQVRVVVHFKNTDIALRAVNSLRVFQYSTSSTEKFGIQGIRVVAEYDSGVHQSGLYKKK